MTNGQTFSDKEIRKINLKAISVIDDYARKCDIFHKSDFYTFKRIFKSETTNVINDVLPDNNLNDQLTIKEYPRKLSRYFDENTFTTKIEILYLSPVKADNDREGGSVEVMVEKFIQGKHKSFDTYYQDTLLLNFHICFDEKNGDYKIENIDIVSKQGKYLFIEAYKNYILGKSRMKNEGLIINGDTVQLDSTGRVFFKDVSDDLYVLTKNKNIFDEKFLKVSEIGVSDNDKKKDKNIEELAFKVPFLFSSMEFGYNPQGFSPVSVISNENDINVTKSDQANPESNKSLSLKLGVILWKNESTEFTFTGGITYGKYNYGLKANSIKYSYQDVDPDSMKYRRVIDVSKIKENHDMTYIKFPFNFNLTYKLFDQNHIGVRFGVNYYESIKSNYEINANALYSGQYPDLYGITISEKGIYDFGEYSMNNSGELNNPNKLISFNFGVNWKYNLDRRNSIVLGLGYEYSQQNMFAQEKMKLSRNYEKINSLTVLDDGFAVKNWNVNFGYIIKF